MLKSGRFQIKSIEEKGAGSAVFATLNVVDKDGDLTIPGAFGSQKAKLVGAHDWSAPSIGSAEINEAGDLAIANFKFNLEMDSGKEWYKSLKWNFEHDIPQEFSYGFDVLKESFKEHDGRKIRILESLKVHEVSPVMVGAGMGTRTMHMKSHEGLTMEAHTAFVEQVLEEYFQRHKSLADLRSKQGRTLSRTTRETLTRIADDIQQFLQEADADTGKTANLTHLDIEFQEMLNRYRRGV